MQTHTITLAVPAAPLTGNIHVEHIPIPKKAEEITINNLGSRIMTIMGNSKKRTAIIIAPGHDMILSKEDIDRMEIAIREPMIHLDMLFGAKGTIRLFQATKDRASETLGVRHTPAMLDAERRLDLLLQTNKPSHTTSDVRERIAALSQLIIKEQGNSVHAWDEITRELFRTSVGRKIFRQMRPLYLERQKKREELELSEFRSVDVLFRRLFSELRPTNIFIGSPEKGGRFEIYARHISKIAGDMYPRLSRPIQDISASSVQINLKSYASTQIDFEV